MGYEIILSFNSKYQTQSFSLLESCRKTKMVLGRGYSESLPPFKAHNFRTRHRTIKSRDSTERQQHGNYLYAVDILIKHRLGSKRSFIKEDEKRIKNIYFEKNIIQ